MLNPYNRKCDKCGNLIQEKETRARHNNSLLCIPCYNKVLELENKQSEFNEPNHYHEHDIDTIEFLKRGFPPQVLTGFLIGNIIKYTQRFEYKNGEEDVLKIVDYAKRLQEWYKETHS
jgi:hypothetical protein